MQESFAITKLFFGSVEDNFGFRVLFISAVRLYFEKYEQDLKTSDVNSGWIPVANNFVQGCLVQRVNSF